MRRWRTPAKDIRPLWRGPAVNPVKQRIQSAFARAAATYDATARVQPQVVEGLIARLPEVAGPRILELGCGTGRLTAALAARYPAAEILAVDFCEAMLQQAQAKLGPQATWWHADAETLEPTPSGVDLLVSSGAMQWFEDLAGFLHRCPAWLAEGGHLAFALFGPSTFHELQSVWPAPLAASGFWSAEHLGHVLSDRFRRVMMHREEYRLEFASLMDLLRHIQATGTGASRRPRLLTPAGLASLEQAYRQRFGRLWVSYEVYFCLASEPVRPAACRNLRAAAPSGSPTPGAL